MRKLIGALTAACITAAMAVPASAGASNLECDVFNAAYSHLGGAGPGMYCIDDPHGGILGDGNPFS